MQSNCPSANLCEPGQNDASQPLSWEVKLIRGDRLTQEEVAVWRELQNLPKLADSLSTLADVYLFSGQYDDALQVADEAWQLSRSIHNTWGESYSQFAVGSIHWDRGDPVRAIEVMEASIRLSIEAGFTAPQSYTRAQLALVYGSLGDFEYGIELSDPVLVSRVREDVAEYAQLGAFVGADKLNGYCEVARELRAAFERQHLERQAA